MIYNLMKEEESLREILSQINQDQRQSEQSLSSIVAKSFATSVPKQNKLLFLTKSLPITRALAISFLESIPDYNRTHDMTLLIDFANEEIECMNLHLAELILLEPKKKYFNDDFGQPHVLRLTPLKMDKRQGHYIKGGIFGLSCQVFLTDLLRGQKTIDPKRIGKIIIKMGEKIRDHYHYYAWLSTILKVQQKRAEDAWTTSIIYISDRPQYYSDVKEMQRIYRTFFCKKIVVWPFYRAEITKRLNNYRKMNKSKEWEHEMSHSEKELQLSQVLMKLYYFLKKGLTSKYKDKIFNIQEILYGSVDQDGFKATRSQFIELENIKYLLSLLDNSNHIKMAKTIASFIEADNCDLWNSNNSQVIEMVEDIQLKLKMRILFFEKVEEDGIVVNLQSLLANSEDLPFTFDEKQQASFVCNYQLNMRVQIIHQQSEKINQLIKVIEDLRVKSAVKRQESPEMSDLQDLQKRLSASFDQNDPPRNVLVICNNRSTSNYVSSYLRNYQANRNYIQFLIQMTDYLKTERKFRLLKLKKIYDRNKVPVGAPNCDNNVFGSKKTWFDENKVILEEILFRQLAKVHELVLNYDLQLSIINQQLANAKSIDTVFTLNQEEINVKARFQEQLNAFEFKIIKKEDIKIFLSVQRGEQIIFQSKNTKIRVVVDHCRHGIEPAHFNQILQYSNPHSIIFYSPSTTLLRSLYLYQLQNADLSLQNIHIFSFKDSYQSKSVAYEVQKENKAFWAISQNRSQLHQFIESPFLRIKDLNMSDSFEQARASLHSRSLISEEGGQKRENTINLRSIDLSGYRRTVIVDSRQFKSSLPSYLYHSGFQVLPMFLKTGDYILSDDIAIEKKSVHTKDLHLSLKGPRLDDQMRRMSQSFKFSYLLIECQEETDCNRLNFGYLDKLSGNKSRFQLRKRLMQLLHKFPNIRLLWSTSVSQSCEYIKQLKKDKPEPDELKFSKYDEEQVEQPTKPLARILEESQRKQEQQ